MKSKFVNKALWIDLFRAIGLSEEKMQLWHQEFEKQNPNGHEEFLAWINLSDKEIQEIRSF